MVPSTWVRAWPTPLSSTSRYRDGMLPGWHVLPSMCCTAAVNMAPVPHLWLSIALCWHLACHAASPRVYMGLSCTVPAASGHQDTQYLCGLSICCCCLPQAYMAMQGLEQCNARGGCYSGHDCLLAAGHVHFCHPHEPMPYPLWSLRLHVMHLTLLSSIP